MAGEKLSFKSAVLYALADTLKVIRWTFGSATAVGITLWDEEINKLLGDVLKDFVGNRFAFVIPYLVAFVNVMAFFIVRTGMYYYGLRKPEK